MQSLLIIYEDFKQGIADTTNQYIEKLPAVFMAEFFEKLASQFKGLAQQQLQAEINKESEAISDEERNSNRTE